MKKNPTIGDIKTQISPPSRRAVSWKTTPLTVGTISTEQGLTHLENPPAGIDLAEIRLDLLLSKGVEPEKILGAMAKKDIPLTNLPRLGRVLRAIRRSKRDLILSSHSLKRKLTPLRLRRLLVEFRKTRAAVYKIVGLARRPRDLRALAEPLLTLPHMRLAIQASGPLATASRLSLPALGSRLLYVHLDEPAAPGQPGHDTSFTLAGLRSFLSAKKA
ncbi:MAG: type I 3-dehydroquinate dehydratase [Verrucomicrobia bacterium]|nr:type I 3-dehydroquinate dehydratase [Verrucomicrobiota bacterium]